MNKKLSLFALPLLVLASAGLSSCDGNSGSDEKVNIVFGDKTLTTVRSIAYLDLKEKVDSKESFLLAVTYTEGCGCWIQETKPTLERYINEKHVTIYHVTRDELVGGGDAFGITIKTGAVSFAVFSEGKVRNCINTNDENTLANYDSFVSYMSSLVNLPRCYYVSLEMVDALRASSSKDIIYYSRISCGDCNYLNPRYLTEFMKNHPNYSKDINVLDMDALGLRYDRNDEDLKKSWTDFTKKYQMSLEGEATYGYDRGFVPTFQLVANNRVVSQSVYFNDSVKYENNKYIVSDSFYTSERLANLEYLKDFDGQKVLKGLELKTDDVDIYKDRDGNIVGYGWKQASAAKYHDPLLEQFLLFAEK